jgi:signal peptide peptidase SppA
MSAETTRVFDLLCTAPWAMEPSALEALAALASREGMDPEAVVARLGRRVEHTETVRVRDGVAVLPVVGPIFRRANLFTQMSGATSVELMATDFRRALDDPSVRAVILDVDSPGGEVNGICELAQMVREGAGTKPVVAYVGGMGCSGGYYIAAGAPEIVVSPSALLGSIGVCVVYRGQKDPHEVEFVSSQSPRKRPDVQTEDGRQVVQETVDGLAAVFVGDVARYRKVSEEKVLAEFGAGGVKVGAAAVAAGMADRVGSLEGLIAELAARTSSRTGAAGGRAMSEVTAGTQVVGSDEWAAMRARLEAAEQETARARAETAALMAQNQRRSVEERLAGLRMPGGPGAMAFTPECRVALAAAVCGIASEEQRTAVLEALGSARVYAVGLVAHEGSEDAGNGGSTVQFSEADRQMMAEEAKGKKVPVSEIEAAWRKVREEREARVKAQYG